MNLKELYAKFKACHPLSDKELDFLIFELEAIEQRIESLGVEFRHAANAIRYDLISLKGFQFHRRFK
jgi:hypothetical protein